MPTIFQTLHEVDKYVHNCVVCGKVMQIYIDGSLKSKEGHHSRWASGREVIHTLMEPKEGIFYSKHKSLKIAVDATNNLIIDGIDFAERLASEFTYVKKQCPTCDFKIETNCMSHEITKEKKFPPLTLTRENLHFTMKGGKSLRISKYYQYTDADPTKAGIALNGKLLPQLPFDFNKFSDFEQLVKRLNTMILFH